MYLLILQEAVSSTEQVSGDIREFYVEKSSDVDELCAAHSNIVAKLFSQFVSFVQKMLYYNTLHIFMLQKLLLLIIPII